MLHTHTHLQQFLCRPHSHLVFRGGAGERGGGREGERTIGVIVRLSHTKTHPASPSGGLKISPPTVSLSGLRQISIMQKSARSPLQAGVDREVNVSKWLG